MREGACETRRVSLVQKARATQATLPETDIRTWAPVDEPSNNILDASNSVLRHRIDLERGTNRGVLETKTRAWSRERERERFIFIFYERKRETETEREHARRDS